MTEKTETEVEVNIPQTQDSENMVEVNTPPTLIPQEQLDLEYKKVQEDFKTYVKEYKFPEDVTKSMRKKMIKKMQLDFFKAIRRKIERQKQKRKRAGNPEDKPAKRRKTKLCESKCNIKVAVDCSFDDLMSEKDISKLSKQIQRCYALNRNMENPLQFHLTHMKDKSLERFESSVDGYQNWDVVIKHDALSELFPPGNIVYLCAESENVLTEFSDDKIYVIGGFVDHNSHKGLAYERAQSAGFQHARLPIDQYFTLATRKVLTVCHVFEMITNFMKTNSWTEAIEKTIPERKGLEPLPTTENNNVEASASSRADNDNVEASSRADNDNVEASSRADNDNVEASPRADNDNVDSKCEE